MTKALLCATVTGETTDALRAARDAVEDADLVELRLDGVAGLDLAGVLAGRRRPVIVTCRPRWEGGRFEGDEADRERLLDDALRLGAEYVDVEWRAGFSTPFQRTGGARIVVSSHDFDGTPPDLAGRHREMRATGAEVVKIAVTPRRLSDTLPLRALCADRRTVAMGMGDAGVATRILASRFGSVWSYAGDGIAPGQIPAGRMLREFRFREVSAASALYGVVGDAALGSWSPAMHNAAFEAAGVNAVYVPLQTADFDDFLTFADAMGVAGASVTIPFKRAALAGATDVHPDASRIGAANTLKRTPSGWAAINTDVEGFLAPLAGIDLHLRASVLGAGGAARAVTVALASRGARVSVHARRAAQAREVAALGGGVAGEWPPAPGSWDLLVNCTPLGGLRHREESPLPGGPFDGRLVYDLIYAPAETRLLREAQAAGCQAINGLPMLVAQAERQFEWWTGRRPVPGVMAQAVTHHTSICA